MAARGQNEGGRCPADSAVVQSRAFRGLARARGPETPMKSLRFCAAGATTMSLIGIWSGSADAAGFASQQFGGEQGSVVATNPTALYYNPGALGFSPGTALGMYGSLAIRHATWTHEQASSDVPDPSGAQGANTGEAKLLNVFGGASVAGSTHIGNLVLGLGFFAPFYG